MDTSQILVTIAGAALIVAVLLFFFGPGPGLGQKPKAESREPKAV